MAETESKVDKVAENQAKKKELAVAIAVSIYHYKWIARSAGISERTLDNWRADDPDFCARLEEARAAFINKNMKKARPDFLLETADRETFGRVEKPTVTINLVDKLLVEYGIKELSEGEDDRKIDEVVSRPSQSKT